jgi:predicted DNA-binding transcriptional regulator AlpA
MEPLRLKKDSRSKKHNKTGRPAWKAPSLLEVEELAARGLTMSQIANATGIGETTLYRKKRELWQFRQAIKKGQALGIASVANKLFELAVSGRIAAIIFLFEGTRRRA